MSMVLFAIASAISFACRIYRETAGSMLLQEAVEIVRHDEEHRFSKEAEKGGFSRLGYHMNIETRAGKVSGAGQKGDWKLEIQMEKYEPEEFLRKISLLEGEGEYGSSLSKGNET